jgi:hypothetical protein
VAFRSTLFAGREQHVRSKAAKFVRWIARIQKMDFDPPDASPKIAKPLPPTQSTLRAEMLNFRWHRSAWTTALSVDAANTDMIIGTLTV